MQGRWHSPTRSPLCGRCRKCATSRSIVPDARSILQSARSRVKAAAGPFPAPLQCVEAVAAAVSMQFEEGLRFERDFSWRWCKRTESRSLRHACSASVPPARFPMCPPISRCARSARLRSSAPARWAADCDEFREYRHSGHAAGNGAGSLATGWPRYAGTTKTRCKKGKLTPEAIRAAHGNLIAGTLSYAEIAQADLVIEAVFEDMGVKEAVFRDLMQ